MFFHNFDVPYFLKTKKQHRKNKHLSNPQTFAILHFPPTSTGHWRYFARPKNGSHRDFASPRLPPLQHPPAAAARLTATTTWRTPLASVGSSSLRSQIDEYGSRSLKKKSKGRMGSFCNIFSDDFRSFCKEDVICSSFRFQEVPETFPETDLKD